MTGLEFESPDPDELTANISSLDANIMNAIITDAEKKKIAQENMARNIADVIRLKQQLEEEK